MESADLSNPTTLHGPTATLDVSNNTMYAQVAEASTGERGVQSIWTRQIGEDDAENVVVEVGEVHRQVQV